MNNMWSLFRLFCLVNSVFHLTVLMGYNNDYIVDEIGSLLISLVCALGFFASFYDRYNKYSTLLVFASFILANWYYA